MCNSELNSYFDKVVEQVDSLLQGLLQVLAERQVLGMVTDLLHSPPLRLLCGLLCPVLIIVVSILTTRGTQGDLLHVLPHSKCNKTVFFHTCDCADRRLLTLQI